MNVKKAIAELQFSHIAFFAVGALIPIYCDVLIFHDFTSSTVSAIMDTFLAITAVYAAFNVKNWMKDKVKNKGYELAEEILVDIHKLHIMNIKLMMRYTAFGRFYMDGEELKRENTERMVLEVKDILKDIDKIHDCTFKLVASIYTIKSWGMICNTREQYLKLCRTTDKAIKSLEYLMSFSSDPNHLGRKISWDRNLKKTKKLFFIVKQRYSSLELRLENAFKYEPVTENSKKKDKK